jgi:DNA-binding MarR family transcriptional regulator
MASVSELSAHTGYLLRMVSNAVSHEFARKVAGEGVTVAEWTVLRSLYACDAVAPTALARQMGMTKGAISKLAERLLDKGLIERTDNPDDKRGYSLSLSATGRAKVPVLAALADRNDADFFAALDDGERVALRGLLQGLMRRHGLTAVPID